MGCCFFEKNICTVLTANDFDDTVEHEPEDNERLRVSHKEFFEMVKHAFHTQASKASIMALFNRAAFVVNAKRWMYVREPNEGEVSVPRFTYPDGKVEFPDDACKDMLGQYREGSAIQPDNLDDLKAWSHSFIKCCISGVQPPPTKYVIGPTLSSDEVALIEVKPTINALQVALRKRGAPMTPSTRSLSRLFSWSSNESTQLLPWHDASSSDLAPEPKRPRITSDSLSTIVTSMF